MKTNEQVKVAVYDTEENTIDIYEVCVVKKSSVITSNFELFGETNYRTIGVRDLFKDTHKYIINEVDLKKIIAFMDVEYGGLRK